MRKLAAITALMLSLSLIGIVFYAIASGIYMRTYFWLLYTLIVIADLLLIRFLKNNKG